MTLRVMTWNLWWRFGPWEERQAAIAAVVAAHQPDVLFAQEVWSDAHTSQAHLLAEELGYHAAISDDPSEGRSIGFHNAIISRWPLTDVDSMPLPGIDGSPGLRRVLAATVRTWWGDWPMMTTHLDYRFDHSLLRQAQAVALLEMIDRRRGDPDVELPVIVAGDFNAVPDSDEIRMLTGRRAAPVPNLVLSDAWEHVGESSGCTWRSDNPYQEGSAWPDRRLDYVFVSWPRPKPVGNPLRVWLAGTDATVGPVPSDHAALVVELCSPVAGEPRG